MPAQPAPESIAAGLAGGQTVWWRKLAWRLSCEMSIVFQTTMDGVARKLPHHNRAHSVATVLGAKGRPFALPGFYLRSGKRVYGRMCWQGRCSDLATAGG